MNRSIIALSAAVLMAASFCAAAAAPAAQASAGPGASTPITYAQILKSIRAGGADGAKTSSLLVGKTAKVKLIASGPQSLMVNRKDMVFFICEKRAAGFKSGDVTSKITQYEIPEDGEISVTLANCSN